jgi:hypothetical protein
MKSFALSYYLSHFVEEGAARLPPAVSGLWSAAKKALYKLEN